MRINGLLQRLLSRTEPEGTVATVTLDVSESGILPAATRVFLKDCVFETLTSRARPPSARPVFQKTGERIGRFVDTMLRPATQGLYLAGGRDIWEAVELMVPLRNFIHIGSSPYLAPLLEAQQRALRAYVARCDAREARLAEVHLGVWSEMERFEAAVPPQDAQRALSGRPALCRGRPRTPGSGTGGAGRDRFERLVGDATTQMLRRVAEKFLALQADAPGEAFFVFASREQYSALRSLLPAALRDRMTHLGAVARNEGSNEERVVAELARVAADRVERETLRFHERRAEGRMASLGPRHVLGHVLSGNAARVFVDAYDPVPGLKCGSCGTPYPGIQGRCDFCVGELAPVSLTQEVVAHALTHPPLPITFVPPPAKWLQEIGGMAALLSPGGMRRKREKVMR